MKLRTAGPHLLHEAAHGSGPHLPHEAVVIVRLHLAHVDELAVEGPEARALADDGLAAEDAVVYDARQRRLLDRQPCTHTPRQRRVSTLSRT